MGVSLSYPFSLANGTTADATQVMANFNAVVTALATQAAENGANSSITSLTGLTSPLPIAAGRTQVYIATGASTGSGNAQANTTLAPGGYAYGAGQFIAFNPGFTNTGAMTYAPNGLTPRNVLKQTPTGLVALTGGEVVAAEGAILFDDGTQFQLINNNNFLTQASLAGFIPFGAEETLASAATTDLGSITPNTHFVDITGTTTITSFGSSASTNAPIYLVKFAASLLLTNNATSLILPNGLNITTQANDYALFEYLGSGNWRCVQYLPASPPGYVFFASGSLSGTTVDIAIPSDAQEIVLELLDVTTSVASALTLQYKVGGTLVNASYQTGIIANVSGTLSGTATTTNTAFPLTAGNQASGVPGMFTIKVQGVQSGNDKGFHATGLYQGSSSTANIVASGANASNTGLISDLLLSFGGTNSFASGTYRAYKTK